MPLLTFLLKKDCYNWVNIECDINFDKKKTMALIMKIITTLPIHCISAYASTGNGYYHVCVTQFESEQEKYGK